MTRLESRFCGFPCSQSGHRSGPVRDAAQRDALRARLLSPVEKGLRSLAQVLTAEPAQPDAMAYLWLLSRRKAELAPTALEYRQTMTTAENWRDRAIAARAKHRDRRGSPAVRQSRPRPPHWFLGCRTCRGSTLRLRP